MIELFSPVGGGGGGEVLRIFTDGDDRMLANIKTRKLPGPKINPPAFNNPAMVLSYFGGSEHRYRI